MTRDRSAVVAGLGYVVYFAAGISNELLMSRATSAEGTAAILARVAGHAMDVRLAIVFSTALLALGVSLQLAGFLTGPMTGYQWVPEIVFTIALALWLLIKGVK